MNARYQTSSFEQWLFRVPRLLINETLRAKCVLRQTKRETTNAGKHLMCCCDTGARQDLFKSTVGMKHTAVHVPIGNL